jgi:Mor family transcriptional regulator
MVYRSKRETDGENFVLALREEAQHVIRRAVGTVVDKGAADPESVAAVAENAASALALDLLYDWGGQQVYLPLRGTLVKEAVLREFNGNNASALARKYRIAHGTVYKWIETLRADHREQELLQQARLPGVE